MQLEIDETFAILGGVYRRALLDANSTNPKVAAEAREWLDICAPGWRPKVAISAAEGARLRQHAASVLSQRFNCTF